jgi:hypothetical protein
MTEFFLMGLGVVLVGASIFVPFSLLLSRLERRKRHVVQPNHALHKLVS